MLIVETGEVIKDAESYVSVEDADQYFADHGSPTQWTSLDNSAKEAALRYAAAYLESNYTFLGKLVYATQPMLFPRLSFYGNDGKYYVGVPKCVKHAQCELALSHVVQSLNTTADNDKRVTEETIGDITVKYAASNVRTVTRGIATKLLAPVLAISPGFQMIRTTRV